MPPTVTKPDERSQFTILEASAISCIVSMTAVNPLEVAKLKSQYAPVLCPQYPHPSLKDLHLCECAKFNFGDAFKGLKINLFQGVVSNTIYMQFYECQRQKFVKYLPSSIATISSALFSRLMVTVILMPIESFRVRYTNSTQKIQITSSKSGLPATLARDLTYSCLYWFMVEQIRNLMSGCEYRSSTEKLNMVEASIVPSMISRSLVSFITTPFDTLKTRLQSGIKLEGSIMSQMKEIYMKEGTIGLFAGVKQRVLRNTINSVIYLCLFESIIEKAKQTKSY